MRTIARIATVAAVAVAASAASLSAQKSETFTWNHVVDAGRRIEIKGVNGGIHAVSTNGNSVRVRAEKRSKKNDVSEVRIEMVESPQGYTLCAVYPTPTRRNARPQRPNECSAGERWNANVDNNDVSVEWTVEVPRGVILVARTTNGGIEVEDLQADVHASTVNGDISVSTTGIVRAGTVNGSIEADMGSNRWTGELSFTTVNGDVAVTFPAGLDAQVRAQTVSGDIETDWPLTVRGQFGSKGLNGTIGSGGRVLALTTVNGSIEIRKR